VQLWLIAFCSFSDINCKKCIVNLLRRIGEAYKVDKRQHKFVEDLMALNIPDLLAGSEDVETAFSNMMHEFIRKYGLQQVILEHVLMIVVSRYIYVKCISYQLSPFQV